MSDLLKLMLKDSFDKIEEASPPFYPSQPIPMMPPPMPMGYGYPSMGYGYPMQKKKKDDDEDDDKKKKGNKDWLKYLLAAGAAAAGAGLGAGGMYMMRPKQPKEPGMISQIGNELGGVIRDNIGQGVDAVKNQITQKDVMPLWNHAGDYVAAKANMLNFLRNPLNQLGGLFQSLQGVKPYDPNAQPAPQPTPQPAPQPTPTPTPPTT